MPWKQVIPKFVLGHNSVRKRDCGLITNYRTPLVSPPPGALVAMGAAQPQLCQRLHQPWPAVPSHCWATVAQGQAHPEGGLRGRWGGSQPRMPPFADINSQPARSQSHAQTSHWLMRYANPLRFSGPVRPILFHPLSKS